MNSNGGGPASIALLGVVAIGAALLLFGDLILAS